MPLRKLARDAGNVMIYRATWGGSQNFLGARWVERLVDNSPAPVRERVAMRFLSLSPHYFYDRDIGQEDERYRRTRQILADELIAPYLDRRSGSWTTVAGPATWPRRWPPGRRTSPRWTSRAGCWPAPGP